MISSRSDSRRSLRAVLRRFHARSSGRRRHESGRDDGSRARDHGRAAFTASCACCPDRWNPHRRRGRLVDLSCPRMKHVLMLSVRNALALVLCLVAAGARAQEARGLPKVRVVATGGTIAGEQREPGTLGGYDIKKSVNEIVALVPNVQRYAQVETEQFSNVPSPSITPDHWLRLAQRINAIFKERPDLAGIVVTHGTARLEETAFFLYLTVASDKPVVVVGAQRPPTGISPDGPINLLSAIRVAAASQSHGKGVTVVMDDRIMSARDVTKSYARSGGFDGAEMGT